MAVLISAALTFHRNNSENKKEPFLEKCRNIEAVAKFQFYNSNLLKMHVL
jgi:hypothetical protein